MNSSGIDGYRVECYLHNQIQEKTKGSLAVLVMFLHSKTKASRKEYKGEC